MKNDRFYNAPTVEIAFLEASDVIRTSELQQITGVVGEDLTVGWKTGG